jgi:voltage-gated potassium channel
MNTAVANLSTYQRIKRRTFEIMEGEVPDKYSHFVEIFIALLVVANVIGIILESVPEIHEAFEHEFHLFDMFSVAVFSVEFVMRVWSYSEKYVHSGGTAWQGRKEYVFSFYVRTCACCVCSV